MLDTQQVTNKKPQDMVGATSQGGYGGKEHSNSTALSESKSMGSREAIKRADLRGKLLGSSLEGS